MKAPTVSATAEGTFYKLYCPRCGKWLLSVAASTRGALAVQCKCYHNPQVLQLPPVEIQADRYRHATEATESRTEPQSL